MHLQQVLSLAAARRWEELQTQLTSPENQSAAAELLPKLEALADQAVASRNWVDASNLYQAAMQCATCVIQSRPYFDDDPIRATLYRVCQQLCACAEQSAGEQARAEGGPLDWDAGTARVIELAQARRFEEAEALLARLDQLSDTSGGFDCGHRLEEAANDLPARQRKVATWFLRQALARYKKAQAKGDADRISAILKPPRPVAAKEPAHPPLVDFEQFVIALAALAREGRRGAWWRLLSNRKIKPLAPQIAEYFAALGDKSRDLREWFPANEFYTVAAAVATVDTGLAQRVQEMTLANIDERLARPAICEATATQPPDWDDLSNRAEWLALAGRFSEADELLLRLESTQDDYTPRGDELPGRYESIGDHLLPAYPEFARWFYERFLDAAYRLAADTAYEGNVRDGVIQTARQKIEQANDRMPRRIAEVEARLSARGMGKLPEPELYVKTVENDQLLKLVPERALYTEQSGADGEPEPIPAHALHRYDFRVWIEGEGLRLFQERDIYGGMRPFAVSDELPGFGQPRLAWLRLEPGKPVVIAYNVPGGGPAWTLTLTGIHSG